MTLLRSLKASLRLLRKEPKVFMPNIGVSLLYGVYELALFKLGLDILAVSEADSAAYIAANLPLFLAVFAFYPVIGALDLITYSMYPSIVADHRAGKRISLFKALRSALSAWRIWVSLGLVILAFILLMTPIVSVFFGLSYLTDNPLLLIPGLIILLVATAFLAISVYFVIPVGIIDKEKTLGCYKKSFLFSVRHRNEVLPLLVVSLMMAFFAAYLVDSSKSGMAQGVAYAGLGVFLAAKVLQSMVYTYISVVNPYFYTEVR